MATKTAQRTMRVLESSPGWARIHITDGTPRGTGEYVIREQDSDFGQAYAVSKVDGGFYDVLLTTDDRGQVVGGCDCKAGSYRGHIGECRHIAAIKRLVALGKL